MQQKLFQNFSYHKKLELQEITWKRNRKSHAQNGIYIYINIYKYIYIYIYIYIYVLCLQSRESGSFLQTCIDFVKERLKFSHFEGSIIP